MFTSISIRIQVYLIFFNLSLFIMHAPYVVSGCFYS